MNLSFLPNLITLCRIVLIVPIVGALFAERFGLALLMFVVAAISDGVDGYFARRFNWRTFLGSFLDPLADKLLLISCYVCLTMIDAVPFWLAVIAIARDLIVFGGALAYRCFIGAYEAAPTWLGKLCTVIEILFIVFVVSELAFAVAYPAVEWVLIAAVTLVCIISGSHYVWTWGRKALKQKTETPVERF